MRARFSTSFNFSSEKANSAEEGQVRGREEGEGGEKALEEFSKVTLGKRAGSYNVSSFRSALARRPREILRELGIRRVGIAR